MPDPYTNPDVQSESALKAMITRLEERGRHEEFRRMIAAYAATLPTERSLKVLDVGCGTGVVIRHLAEVLHAKSVLHGADISQGLLREAARLTEDPRVRWDHVTSERLPFADGEFDVITMHTLLSHVPDAPGMLREARRLLRNGGRLIVFDADHAGTTYAQPDLETTRRMDHLLTSAIATHPDICRRMPSLLKEAGLDLKRHRADVIAECGKGDYWLSSVRGFARLMPTLGVLTPEEANAWTEHLLHAHEEGTFFAAGSFYTFFAEAG